MLEKFGRVHNIRVTTTRVIRNILPCNWRYSVRVYFESNGYAECKSFIFLLQICNF